MAAINYYGVIAVKYTGSTVHKHHISHLKVISVSDNTYYYPGKLYTKAEVLSLMKTNSFYTLIWDYSKHNWCLGAEVDIEVVGVNTYLRTKADSTTLDNLASLIDVDYFGL